MSCLLRIILVCNVLVLTNCGPYTIDLDPGYGPGLCTVTVTDVSTSGAKYLLMNDLKEVRLKPEPPVGEAIRTDVCTRPVLAQYLGKANFISVRIANIELSAETTPRRIYHGNMSGILEIRSLERNTRKLVPIFITDTLDSLLVPHPAEGAEKLLRNMIPKFGLQIEHVVEDFIYGETTTEERSHEPSISRSDEGFMQQDLHFLRPALPK